LYVNNFSDSQDSTIVHVKTIRDSFIDAANINFQKIFFCSDIFSALVTLTVTFSCMRLFHKKHIFLTHFSSKCILFLVESIVNGNRKSINCVSGQSAHD